MAALTDPTRQLLERTHELRRQANGADADFRTMALLADDIGELADTLAATFEEIDELLTRSPLARLSVDHSVSDAAEGAVQPSQPPLSEAEQQPSPEQRRPWFARLFRPVRWLRARLRNAWQALGSRTPSERAEFA